jgi:hypothetical protein
MTRRPPETCLFLTEAETAERVGLAALDWKAAVSALEKTGLPRPDPLFGGRRYWPAVKAFLDRRAGVQASSRSPARDGEERWT